MKTTLQCIAIACMLSGSLIGQTLKKTFYDFQKTKVEEEYYVNSRGEKNGAYKAYAKNGVLTEEASFINGEMNGVHKLYDWTTGKALLRQYETYKGGIKQGEAKYFDGKNYSILVAHGNYQNGMKEGVWTIITKFDGDGMPAGCQYYQSTVEYKNDELVKEGDVAYYYPSKKLFYKTKGDTMYSYFPEGKLNGITVMDANGKTIFQTVYDREGNVVDGNK